MDIVHQRVAPELALYAVGAVDPLDVTAIDTHVATCTPCQDELRRLREAASMLAPVSRRDLDVCWDRIAAQVRRS
jgi:anti-sigma factor ChrR (cupin superfamily)